MDRLDCPAYFHDRILLAPLTTASFRIHMIHQDSSGDQVWPARVEEIPRPLLLGASRDSLRDQDESSIIADSMIAQSFHYLPLRPVVCVLVRCRRRRCRPHDPKSCSRRASRRRAWRRRCSCTFRLRFLVPSFASVRLLLAQFVCACWRDSFVESCPCLFVGLVLVRARWVIASG